MLPPRTLMVIGSLSALVACSETVGGIRATDAAARDVPADTGARSCAASALDANIVGVGFGATTLVSLNLTADAVDASVFAGCGTAVTGRSSAWIRYTMRTTAVLTIESAAGPDAPRIVVRDRCGAPATTLACGGDRPAGTLQVNLPASTEAPVAVGSAVYVAIARNSTTAALRFTEVATVVAEGGACDPTRSTNVCAAGLSCADQGPRRVAVCARRGAPYTRCRADDACAEGFRCVFYGGLDGFCTPSSSIGEPCTSGRCASGACYGSDSTGLGRCMIEPPFGYTPRCDVLHAPCAEGQACTPAGCRPARAIGERCTAHRAWNEPGCVVGAVCSPDTTGVFRCVREGSVGARCDGSCGASLDCRVDPSTDAGVCAPRRPSAPGESCWGVQCVDGAVCLGGVCARTVGAGEACDGFRPCASGYTCVGPSDAIDAGTKLNRRCVRDGTAGAACRMSPPHCDAGLSCTAGGVCLPPVAPGAVCAPSGCGALACEQTAACEGNGRCDGTCRRDGAEGGWCRASAQPCDPGLQCTSQRNARGPEYVCIRARALGEACALAPVLPCVAGLLCDLNTGRCAPAPTPLSRCGTDAPPCPDNTSCVNRVCHIVRALGEPCDDVATVCAKGAVCSRDGRCVTTGTVGGPCRASAPQCDAGLTCEVDGVSGRSCRVTGGCGSDVCPAGMSCSGGRCVTDGTVGGRCLDAATRCMADAVCVGAICTASAAMSGTCRAQTAPCPEGIVCADATGVQRCADLVLTTSTAGAARFDMACELRIEELATPLELRILGQRVLVRLSPDGTLTLPSVEFSPLGEVAYGEIPSYSGCRRVVGSAPDRRVVWTFVGAPGELSWEVAFFERGGAIELRYDAPSTRWASPSIRVGAAQLVFPSIPVGHATLVRATPR